MATTVLTPKQKAAAKARAAKAAKIAKEKAKQVGESVVKNPMTAVYFLGGIAVIYGIYKLVNFGSNVSGGKNVDNAIEVADDLKADPKKTTITKTQAKVLASQMLKAFNHTYWGFAPFPGYHHGTDTKVLKEIFDRITPDDFILIYKEFGKKPYLVTGSPPKNTVGGIIVETGVAQDGDLVFWLREELGFFDFSLKSKVQEIVRKAGFVFA